MGERKAFHYKKEGIGMRDAKHRNEIDGVVQLETHVTDGD